MLGLPCLCLAQQGPFPIRTQQPIYLQTVTILPTRAAVLDPGVLEIRADSAYSNLFENASNGAFNINLDMELWRVGYVVSYGFLPDWEASLEIATLHFEGGFLDSFVQDFHDAFGFPNGGRGAVANGAFSYAVLQNGQALYNVAPQSYNAGDLTVTLKNQILPELAWLFAMKFPSRSDNAGFGLGVAAEKSHRRVHGYLNLNFLVDDGNEGLENLMHKTFFDFSAAGEYSFSKKVSALLQLVGGTPRLKGTGLETWDGVPLDLIIGARGSEGKFFWQAAFSEDVTAVGPSVDFTAWISVGMRGRVSGTR